MHAGIVKLQARKHMPSPVRPQPHTHACARAHTHSPTRVRAHTQDYTILITFPRQQWFHKRAAVLRHTYIACLVDYPFVS